MSQRTTDMRGVTFQICSAHTNFDLSRMVLLEELQKRLLMQLLSIFDCLKCTHERMIIFVLISGSLHETGTFPPKNQKEVLLNQAYA